MLRNQLYKRIDNSALIVFRIIFGLLIFLESVGAIFTGWVKSNIIDPQFHFNFIGFDWLQPLPGYGMYIYYALMGAFGFMVMLGLFYRWALGGFTLMWTATYLMQKTSYNNHYYLLILLCCIMLFLPANHYGSLDARRNPSIKELSMPAWCRLVLILQMAIAYFYGAIAKIYPDWFDGTFISNGFTGRYRDTFLGPLFANHNFHLFISYSGFLYDLLIIPMLLWRKTRFFGLIASLCFHLFNSAVFGIGIFPYLSLAFLVFFYPPETIRRIFLKQKPPFKPGNYNTSVNKPILVIFALYFSIQLLLPLRHHLIKGNVFWTEEGHRMSWRMMLRSPSAYITFYVEDKNTGKREVINLTDYLTEKQQRRIGSQPDMIWQFARHLKEVYAEKGKDVAVYANSYKRLNGGEYHPFTDPEVDLANVHWDPFHHSEWLYPFPGWGKK